jgi:hypothetical protein
MFLQFGGYTLVRSSKDLFGSFGFKDQPVIIGLIIFQVCLKIVCNGHHHSVLFFLMISGTDYQVISKALFVSLELNFILIIII